LLRVAALPLIAVAATLLSLAIHVDVLPAPAAQFLMLAIGVIMALVLERWLPLRQSWRRHDGEVRVDAQSWAVMMFIVDPLMKFALLPGLMVVATAVAPPALLEAFPREWPVLAQFVLALLIAETGQYALHRLAHRPGALWPMHRVHHNPARVYWLNGFRVHPLNIAWHQVSGVFALMAIGTPQPVVQMVVVVAVAVSVMQHVNADIECAGFNRVFSTPDLHRWHHALDAKEAACNFGTTLVVWDRLLGTYRPAIGRAPDAVGVMGARSGEGYVAQVLGALRRDQPS
jgi:sterol desaturase/sphingolipid hydroxylase (fatty acid hydroxylase superfamily)